MSFLKKACKKYTALTADWKAATNRPTIQNMKPTVLITNFLFKVQIWGIRSTCSILSAVKAVYFSFRLPLIGAMIVCTFRGEHNAWLRSKSAGYQVSGLKCLDFTITGNIHFFSFFKNILKMSLESYIRSDKNSKNRNNKI